MKSQLVMVFAFAMSCSGTSLRDEPVTVASQSTESKETTFKQPEGALCVADADCTPSTFCNVGYTFGETRCVPLIAIGGGFAASASHCQSGYSARNICVDPAQCAPDTFPCLNDAHCCNSGRACLWGSCVARQADGERCSVDAECSVGRCSFGKCGFSGTCSSNGSHCGWDNECCEGSFCDNASAASTKRCTTMLPFGAPCTRSHECASDSCSNWLNGVCQ